MAKLDYENEILLNAINEDQLFIMGKGLPMQNILANLIESYASQIHLVFVLSSSSAEEEFFRNNVLTNEKLYFVTAEMNANERKTNYRNGGVFFVTSRILVVDFLKENVPIEKINGLILLRAHNIIECTQEAFILRLYRLKNKTGFIKAFSSSPSTFLLGYSRLHRVMRSCFLANVSLWPRFHESISKCLRPKEDDEKVVELQLHATENMQVIERNLLELVSWSISEIKRLVPSLNDEVITVEMALTKGFEKVISSVWDPMWNTINSKAKEVLNELKVFRFLLTQLTKLDCVSFYSLLCNYTNQEAALKYSWLLTKAADNVIESARCRLFPSKTDSFSPEIFPKWLALSEILNEIYSTLEIDIRAKKESLIGIDTIDLETKLKVLIFVEDDITCRVLKNFLTLGSLSTLYKIAINAENIKPSFPESTWEKVFDRICESSGNKSGKRKKLAEVEDSETEKNEKHEQITLTQLDRKYKDIDFVKNPVIVRAFGNTINSAMINLYEDLEAIKPDVIILYECSLELIRTVEVFRTRYLDLYPIKVYFLSFHNAVEEQIYLMSITREKQAFEKLIEEKNTMVVPKEREAKDEINQDLWRDSTKANQTVSTGSSRRDMGNRKNESGIILVDMREFRSELPSLIHKRGIDLEPITLDVGDYILTPQVCVERKSVSDLIGSLNSGRLYKQAEAMARHYKKPVLLIEHEGGEVKKASILQRRDMEQITPKLQLLSIKFSSLKIIWSPGAHYSAELFHELKRGKPQPSAEMALTIHKEQLGSYGDPRFNPISHSLVSKLPGVSSNNVYKILNNFSSMDDLVKATESELQQLLDSPLNASLLYAGLHSKLLQQNEETKKRMNGKSLRKKK